jgi:hypothetical protein
MSSFGVYRLSYEPPSWGTVSCESTVDMSISGEADIPQMLDFFESFLKAVGYILDGKEIELVDKQSTPATFSRDIWDDDGVSLVGNPWAATMNSQIQDSMVYVGSGLKGAEGDDHLSFDRCFGNNVVTFG